MDLIDQGLYHSLGEAVKHASEVIIRRQRNMSQKLTHKQCREIMRSEQYFQQQDSTGIAMWTIQIENL